MSFLPINLTLWSAPPLPVASLQIPQWWGYFSSTDSIATVSASGYFNIDPGALLQSTTFRVGDLIYCSCSDGIVQLEVTALIPNITTIAFAVAAGSVNTAAIQNGAVTTPKLADGAVTNLKVDAAAAIAFSKLAALASGNILVGSAGTVPTSVAMSGDATIVASGALTISANAITTAKILNANVTLAKLAAGITPSHVVKFAGQPTTVGGAAAEAFTVAGIAATDLAFVQIVDDGTGNVTVLQAVCTLNTLTITFSANPGNNTVFNYQILRAAV